MLPKVRHAKLYTHLTIIGSSGRNDVQGNVVVMK